MKFLNRLATRRNLLDVNPLVPAAIGTMAASFSWIPAIVEDLNSAPGVGVFVVASWGIYHMLARATGNVGGVLPSPMRLDERVQRRFINGVIAADYLAWHAVATTGPGPGLPLNVAWCVGSLLACAAAGFEASLNVRR